MDVSGLLHRELDDQPRSMNAIVEWAAEVARLAAPRKVQLVEPGPLNGLEMPLGGVMICIAHVFIDQGEQQLLLRRIEVAGGKALEPAQAVAPADAGQHIG